MWPVEQSCMEGFTSVCRSISGIRKWCLGIWEKCCVFRHMRFKDVITKFRYFIVSREYDHHIIGEHFGYFIRIYKLIRFIRFRFIFPGRYSLSIPTNKESWHATYTDFFRMERSRGRFPVHQCLTIMAGEVRWLGQACCWMTVPSPCLWRMHCDRCEV